MSSIKLRNVSILIDILYVTLHCKLHTDALVQRKRQSRFYSVKEFSFMALPIQKL